MTFARAGRLARCCALGLGVLLGGPGCGFSPQGEFIGDRIPDRCGSNWPVCETFAGCRLDNTSYIEGKLPGTRKVIVHTNGPAKLDVYMLVENASAQGARTSITFFEPGCGVQYREVVEGKTFFSESQSQSGLPFARGREVSQAGDHLVLIDSDATATYLLKIQVTERTP